MFRRMTDPSWMSRGKTVAQLIEELHTFEDQGLEVRLSLDGGDTSVPISLLTRRGSVAVLENCETTPSVRRHDTARPT